METQRDRGSHVAKPGLELLTFSSSSSLYLNAGITDVHHNAWLLKTFKMRDGVVLNVISEKWCCLKTDSPSKIRVYPNP